MRARMLQHWSGDDELEARRPSAAGSRTSDDPGLMIVLVLILMIVLALCGCATKAGTSAVHGDISRVQAHIEEAQGATDMIDKQNQRAAELAQRIHDKDVLINRWHETHTKQ